MDVPIVLSKAEELNAKGAQFFREGHLEPARLHFLAALSIEPDQPQVLQNLGATLRSLNHFEASESVARRSVVASKGNPFCLSNLGVAQLGLKKYNEALLTLRDVTKALPESGPSWHNYGLVLYMLGRFDEALVAFDKSLACGYTSPQLLSDRGLTLLALGRIQDGLEAYEVRWEVLAQASVWRMRIPEWKGEPLIGTRVLVHHEQGYGDSLMLVRFVKLLAKQAAHITLAVPAPLMALFERSFPFLRVIDLEQIPETAEDNFDYHTPLLSVMRWLGVKQPKEIDASPYLIADAMRPVVNLPEAKLKIGICWASGNHGPALMERRRVVPLTAFLPMSEIPGVSLISLQVGRESGEVAVHGMEGIVFDLTPKLDDFSITADVISRLHIVISVDSAVAHLAGALGKTCLMLSPYSRCWRWWNKTSGWPWYERMTIFHQSQNGSWGEAMWNVTKSIRTYMKENRDML